MMHQIAYGFYLSIKKCSKLGQKSAAHFVSFFVYALLHRLSYAPRFCKLKDLIKIYICGTFQHYSICGREVKGFWIDSASMIGSFLRFFGPLLSQILLNLADILTRGSLQ